MKKLITSLPVLAFAFLSLATPALAAGVSNNPITLKIQAFMGFINDTLVPLLFSVAFIVFLFGIFQYFILGGADEEKRNSGKQFAVWGLIAFFVMVSVWGLVNFLTSSLGFDNNTRPCTPTFSGTPCSSSPSGNSGSQGGGDLFGGSDVMEI